MASNKAIPALTGSETSSRVVRPTLVESTRVPWYIWCSVVAVTSAMIGAHWDISWHMSIGRDSFWTPAHVAIYLCGVLAGISCGYLILSTTFGGRADAQESGVRIWGFSGPLGAFMAAWGGIAMITSAPFDNWWHNAYGLDVKILSPPHVVLISGVLAVKLGSLILILGAMNRAQGKLRRWLNALFLYIGGTVIIQAGILTAEHTWRGAMHSAAFYQVVALAIPVALVAVSKASGRRWASTVVATVYTVFCLGMLWILPLFPAEPKLGPVYQRVTHFIPLPFPLLLIAPAVALDLLRPRIASCEQWRQAFVGGVVFLLAFIAVQWPFADFLMSPLSRNRVFGTHYFGYNDVAGFFYNPNQFVALEKTRGEFWIGMAAALLIAIITTRIGLAWGKWMEQIRR
jgi:hypothetical protein